MFPETVERGLVPRAHGAAKRVPRADILEGPGELTLLLDLPGFQEGEIEIGVDKRVLFVTATPSASPEKGEERKALHRERARLPHERAFKLLDDVDVEGITASLASGVLTVRLPRKPEPGSRRIPVGLTG